MFSGEFEFPHPAPPAVEIAFAHAEVGAGFLFGEELLFEIFGARRISCRIHADVGMSTERGGVGVVTNGGQPVCLRCSFSPLGVKMDQNTDGHQRSISVTFFRKIVIMNEL